MHHRLPSAFAKGAIEVVAIVESEIISRERLAAVFVYSLKNLVASGIAETGEERGELAAEGGGGLVFENYFVEAGG